MWFPTEGLDGTLINVMNYLPFKNAAILVQNTLNGVTDINKDFLYPLIILLIYSVLIFVLAIVVFKKKMKSK